MADGDQINENHSFKQSLNFIFTGAVSGLIADSIMHPVDTIRAKFQIEKVGQGQYKGTLHALRTVLRTEGIYYLYKGFPIVATATIPAHSLYFYGYEQSKVSLAKWFPSWGGGPLGHFTAGFIADAFGSLIWVPMDIIKQRLQVQTNTIKLNPNQTLYKGSFHAANVIYKEEGIRGLYRGFIPALMTYGPFVGIYFTAYEKLKSNFTINYFKNHKSTNENDKLPIYYNLFSGFVAGSFAAAVTCPLDVIKTRIQVQRSTDIQSYKGVVDAFKTILREEGPLAFVKGVGVRIWWIAPGTAITIAVCMYTNLPLSVWNSY